MIPMAGGAQIRLGDEEVHVLRTDAPGHLVEILSALDGDHDRAELLGRLGPGAAHELDGVLARLAEAGLLSPAPSPDGRAGRTGGIDRIGGPAGASAIAGDEVARYLSHSMPASEDPAAPLRGARVAVFGNGQSTSLLTALLAEHGLAPATPPSARPDPATDLAGSVDLAVCVLEAPDLALSFEVNDAVCRAARPCLFVDLSHGRHATVGPFFVPGEGACHRCLRARLHESTAAFEELRAAEQHMLETGKPLPAFGCLPAHRHLVCGLAAAEVVAFFTSHRPLRTLNRAITVAFERLEMWSEPVWRVPWCEACR